MFRDMRRFKQEISKEECIEVLKNEPRGVLGVIGDDGYPYTMPLNHYFDEASGKIYFHGAKNGHKMDAIKRCDKVSFCVYDQGYRKENEWALNIKSVIIFGRMHVVEDPKIILEMIRKLGLKNYPDVQSVEEEIKRSLKNMACFELEIEHMSGKLVNES